MGISRVQQKLGLVALPYTLIFMFISWSCCYNPLLGCLIVLNAILTQMFKYWFCAIFSRVLSVCAIFYKLGNCPLLSTNTLNTSNRPSSRRIRLCQNYTHCTPKYPSLCYEIHPRWLFDVYFVRFAETTHVSECYWLTLTLGLLAYLHLYS